MLQPLSSRPQPTLVTSLARPGGNVTGLSILAPELVGKRLELIKQAVPGLTQAGLAEKVGVSRVHLANIESADAAGHHRTPSLALLDNLAKALKVKLADLVK